MPVDLSCPFALISDIHANLEALQAVLQDIERQQIRDVVCLGDIVGYGPDPDKVLDLVKSRAKLTVCGNHDWAVLNEALGFNKMARGAIAYQKGMLEPKFYQRLGSKRGRWEYLQSLPKTAENGDLQFVHGSLLDPLMDYCFADRQRMWNPKKIDELMPRIRWVCFAGHTHFPAVIRNDKECWYPAEKKTVYDVEPGRKYIVNVGSVGQPRDRDPRACYAIFDGRCVIYRRISYDVETTRRKIKSIGGLEDYLGERLARGR